MKKNDHRRCGVTLLEMLLVLGLLVAIMGIGFPSVYRLQVKNQLKSTTKQLQAELLRTRLAAMKTGKAYVFRYRYGTSEYEILTKEQFEARRKETDGAGAFMVGGVDEDTPDPPGATFTGIHVKRLPDRIVFGRKPIATPTAPGSFVGADQRFEFEEPFENETHSSTSLSEFQTRRPAVGEEEDFTSETDAIGVFDIGSSPADEGWSPTVLFYPNGRTSQASLTLQTTGRYNYAQELLLRGLTGTARIADDE